MHPRSVVRLTSQLVTSTGVLCAPRRSASEWHPTDGVVDEDRDGETQAPARASSAGLDPPAPDPRSDPRLRADRHHASPARAQRLGRPGLRARLLEQLGDMDTERIGELVEPVEIRVHFAGHRGEQLRTVDPGAVREGRERDLLHLGEPAQVLGQQLIAGRQVVTVPEWPALSYALFSSHPIVLEGWAPI